MSIMTVRGEIQSSEIGITDTHDHLFLNGTKFFKEPLKATKYGLYNQKITLDNLSRVLANVYAVKENLIFDDFDLAANELTEFKKAGGRTFLDPTPVDLGRDVSALKKLANLLDLNIITATGYFKHEYNAEILEDKTVADIYDEMMKEITYGIGDTGIRPGVIGELGTGVGISPTEEMVLIAAAQVNKDTGLPMLVHIEPWLENFYQVFLKASDILTKNGADLKKVCFCHLSHGFFEYNILKNILKSGTNIGFDDFGEPCMGPLYAPSDIHKIDILLKLVEDGFIDQILMGNDCDVRTKLHSYGGFGYDHFISNIIPVLRKKGLSGEQAEILLIKSPGKFLNIAK
jgi:phosphotriesterase-related protein